MHGHNYIVKATISSNELDAVGFVIDYHDLDWFKRLLDTEYDHRDLNAIVPFNPTAELLAQHFQAKLTAWLFNTYGDRILMVSVGVSETLKTWAWSDNLDELDED